MNRPRFDEEWLVAVLDSLDEGVMSIDIGGRVVAANPSAERLLCFSINEVRWEHFSALGFAPVLPDGRPFPPGDDPVTVTLRTGATQQGVVVGIDHPERGVVWLTVNTRFMPSTEAAPDGGIVVSLADITPRVRAQSALTRQLAIEDLVSRIAARLLAAVPHELDTEVERALGEIGTLVGADRGVVLLLRDTGRVADLTHEWVAEGINPRKALVHDFDIGRLPWLLSRLRRDEAVAMPRLTDLPGDAVAEHDHLKRLGVRSAVAVPMRAGETLVGILAFSVLRGERSWSLEEVAILRLVGDIFVNALLRRQDQLELALAAGELHRHAAELQRVNEELRVADQLKSDFVSMTSHELRTPLATMLGFGEVLVTEWEGLDERERRDYVAAIHRQTRHLFRLVDDLLVVSRIESGTLVPATEDVPVVEFVDEGLAVLPDGREVDVDVPEGLRAAVDRDHGRRIVLNLVENATKYGAPPIAVAARRTGDVVELRVTDHGAGVDPGFVHRLFDKFSQASTGTSRQATGTGLGLAIVRGLCRLNGGDIFYEPGVPSGACFVVHLPAAD